MSCGSSSRSHGLLCSVRLWYFPIILTYLFGKKCRSTISVNMFANCKIFSFTNNVVHDHICFHSLKRFLFHYKRPFMGQRQPVQTQIRHRILRCLIRIVTFCLQKVLLNLKKNTKTKKHPTSFRIRNQLVLLIRVGKSIQPLIVQHGLL